MTAPAPARKSAWSEYARFTRPLALGAYLFAIWVAIGNSVPGLHGPRGALVAMLLVFVGETVAAGAHETGHALAAMAVRWRVIAFAVHPLVYNFCTRQFVPTRRVKGRRLVGYVVPIPGSAETATAARWACVLAGGPAASFALGLMLLAFWGGEIDPGAGPDFALRQVALIYAIQSFRMGLVTLMPFAKDSDGAKLRHLWTSHQQWEQTQSSRWMANAHVYRMRLRDQPRWLREMIATQFAEHVGIAGYLAAFDIGVVLDTHPVDAARARALLDDYRESFGSSEWHASCDAYLAAVWEADGPRAQSLLWQGEEIADLAPLRFAAEAAVAARLGMSDAARLLLDRMDSALRTQTVFRDDTFIDIRRQIEAVIA